MRRQTRRCNVCGVLKLCHWPSPIISVCFECWGTYADLVEVITRTYRNLDTGTGVFGAARQAHTTLESVIDRIRDRVRMDKKSKIESRKIDAIKAQALLLRHRETLKQHDQAMKKVRR